MTRSLDPTGRGNARWVTRRKRSTPLRSPSRAGSNTTTTSNQMTSYTIHLALPTVHATGGAARCRRPCHHRSRNASGVNARMFDRPLVNDLNSRACSSPTCGRQLCQCRAGVLPWATTGPGTSPLRTCDRASGETPHSSIPGWPDRSCSARCRLRQLRGREARSRPQAPSTPSRQTTTWPVHSSCSADSDRRTTSPSCDPPGERTDAGPAHLPRSVMCPAADQLADAKVAGRAGCARTSGPAV
jgi:hypothetical protein